MKADLRTAVVSLALSLAPALLAPPAAAQLSQGGLPPSSWIELAPAPTFETGGLDAAALLAEDALRGKDQPFRFGETLAVDLGPGEIGSWQELPDGSRVWRLRIRSEGAHSLAPLFSSYRVPLGAQLFVYDDRRATVLGAYGDLNNKEDGQFAVQPVAGDAITLEYAVPAGAASAGELRISGVVHDYRDLFRILGEDKGGDGSGDGACEIDVACPEGAPWSKQIRSVALILNGGTLCTGALINNSKSDGTRYFITASHCGSLNNAVFRFNYQKSGCGTGGAPTNQTVQGSVQMAVDTGIDYRLVRLTSAIPVGYNVYYPGWNRSGTAPASTLTVHHPGGGVKKISFDFNPPSKIGQDWRINQWDIGVTEAGSSGCPLFDNAGRFIGQLWGGQASCGFPFNDYFGRLDAAWPQISSILDPLGSGAQFIDGYDPVTPPSPPTLSSVSPPSVPALAPDGQVVTLTGTNLSGVSSVVVGGVVLGPGAYSISGGTQITFTMPLPNSLGTNTVQVNSPAGSASIPLAVLACHPPVVDLQNSSPYFLLNPTGVTVTMASEPGDLVFLYGSTSNQPSFLPGVIDFDIGNDFVSLVALGTHTVHAVKGWAQYVSGPLSVPAGSAIYIQGAAFPDESGTFLVESSNVQQGLIIF